MVTVTLEPIADNELDEVATLLDENDLPADDVRSQAVRFYRARSEEEIVGVGGVEVYGSTALLRSIVIEESARGNGYGTSLICELQERAASLGATEAHLLTTTAAAFFRECGFEEIDRVEVPAAIRETAQFSTLCPDSAVCMRKRVE